MNKPDLARLCGDLRYTLRTLKRDPWNLLSCLIVLALGVGTSTAILSFADSVLLRPLPYAGADQTFALRLDGENGNQRSSHDLATLQFFEEIVKAGHPTVEDVAVRSTQSGRPLLFQTRAGEPRSLWANTQAVSAAFFRTLEVTPIAGRFFDDEVEAPLSSSQGVVVSADLYQRVFAEDKGVVGKVVSLGGREVVILGVAPASLATHFAADVYEPFVADSKGAGTNYQIYLWAREGISLQALNASLAGLKPPLQRVLGMPLTPRVVDLRETLGGALRPTIRLLLATVGFVLLACLANVLGLTMARLARRWRDFSVRTALGAGKRQLVRLVLLENVVVATLATLGAVACAVLLQTLIRHQAPGDILRWDTGLDLRVVAVAVLLGMLMITCLSFLPIVLDSVPARHSSRLKRGHSSSQSPWRKASVVSLVAISFVLLFAALLLAASLLRLSQVDLGFESAGVTAGTVTLNDSQWAEANRVDDLLKRSLERFRSLPNVAGAAFSNNLPGQRALNLPVKVTERHDGESGSRSIDWHYVSRDYFEVLEIPVLAGRTFDERESRGAPPGALVNLAFVRSFYPGDTDQPERALGRTVQVAPFAPQVDHPLRTILGVVADTQNHNLRQEPVPALYVPAYQVTSNGFALAHGYFPTQFVIKARAGGEIEVSQVERAFREVAPSVPLRQLETLASVLGNNVAAERFLFLLLGLLSTLAVVMAGIGLSGLMASYVFDRRSEMGVRLALGARPASVGLAVVRGALRLAIPGVVLGALLAVLSSGLVRALSVPGAGIGS